MYFEQIEKAIAAESFSCRDTLGSAISFLLVTSKLGWEELTSHSSHIFGMCRKVALNSIVYFAEAG